MSELTANNQTRILDNILDHIGGTPMVRINRIGKEFDCEIVAKCEFFNAGGSVKDRIGKRMVEFGEKEGIIKPGYTLIEPTSGNTGIGLALAAAVKGYKAIITLPEKMSQEKVDILKALGAEIIRTPTEAAWNSPDSHIAVAAKLNKEIENSWIPDQYQNRNNPDAHYYGTAEEIYSQCGGKLDVFVAGAGTGGTLSGTAKRLKELLPNIKIVGIDPYGSILAQPEELNKSDVTGYQIEGIGYDFVPAVCDRSLVDLWIKTNDKEAFLMARKLIRDEGLLCGGSSGTAMVFNSLKKVGALIAIKKLGLKKGQRVCVVLPDSIRNYMTKFLNEDWMKKHGFIDEQSLKEQQDKKLQWHGAKVMDLNLSSAITIPAAISIKDAISIMKSNSFDQLPVTSASDSKHVVGLVTLGGLLAKIAAGKVAMSDKTEGAMYKFKLDKKFTEITMQTPLETLSRFFETNSSAVVTRRSELNELLIVAVVTKVDLLTFLMSKNV